ncbi:hypothetical protein ACUXST_001522 [Sphingomonas sp. F9_3S_D5_B_2]
MFIGGQSPRPEGRAMLIGAPVLLFALAQTASAAAGAPNTAPPSATVANPADPCRSSVPGSDTNAIIVCAPKPQGYRIDPDILKARREAHNNRVHPKGREMMKDNPCATVGPMGCRGNAGIDLVNAAGVLAQMAGKLSRGENVGKMFETDPQPSEYQLYVEAKKRREAEEAQAAAKATARAARSAAAQPAAPAASAP